MIDEAPPTAVASAQREASQCRSRAGSARSSNSSAASSGRHLLGQHPDPRFAARDVSAGIEIQIEDIGHFSELAEFLGVPVLIRRRATAFALRDVDGRGPQHSASGPFHGCGDASFIQQSKVRMDQMMERAQLVAFATHALDLLPKVCERTIGLDHRRIVLDGQRADVVGAYLDNVGRTRAHRWN